MSEGNNSHVKGT